jgi:hypothetical protein
MSNVCEEAQMRLVPRLTSLELQSGQTRQDAADSHAMGVRDPLQQEEQAAFVHQDSPGAIAGSADLISGAQAPTFRCGESADPTRIAASSPVGENIHQYG